MNTEKWDIVARTDGSTDSQQKYEMAKTLLADRFQLQFHRETREMPVYSLVVWKDRPRFEEPKPDEDGGLRVSSGLLIGHKWDISTFANLLSSQLNIPIADKAGLRGIYDFELKWSPAPDEGNFTPNANSDPALPIDPSGPTILRPFKNNSASSWNRPEGRWMCSWWTPFNTLQKIDPTGKISIFVADPRMLFVDEMWIDEKGFLWMPAVQLNRLLIKGGPSPQLPFQVLKIQTG